jgi:hypothetical protein
VGPESGGLSRRIRPRKYYEAQRQKPPPEPVASISTNVASGRPARRIKPSAEHMRRAHEHRLERLRVRATHSAPEPERGLTPATGTRPGMRKAGLSVRMISSGTGIPVGSVHRAMRAIARAEAKKEPPEPRAPMTSKRRERASSSIPTLSGRRSRARSSSALRRRSMARSR